MVSWSELGSFLGGSVVTLIIKEFVNQYNKRQDFKRDLAKMTYSRKLEKAEAAVAFYWTYLDKVINIKKSVEVIIKAAKEMDEKDYDITIILQNLSKVSASMEEMSGVKYLDVHAINLYFDLDKNSQWSEIDLGDLLHLYAEMTAMDKEINLWVDLHNNAQANKNVEFAEACWQNALEILPNYLVKMQGYLDLIEKNRSASHAVIQTIRKELNFVDK
jgi:tetratricopeptide (TPR) repeat protein